jgi:hypothetical protein
VKGASWFAEGALSTTKGMMMDLWDDGDGGRAGDGPRAREWGWSFPIDVGMITGLNVD